MQAEQRERERSTLTRCYKPQALTNTVCRHLKPQLVRRRVLDLTDILAIIYVQFRRFSIQIKSITYESEKTRQNHMQIRHI